MSAGTPHALSPSDETDWGETFLLDSDVAIEHLRGRPWTAGLFRDIAQAGGAVCYSPVTAAEIYHGLRPGEEATTAEIYHGLRPGEEATTARLFASLICLPIDHAIGQEAGEYLRRYRASHGLALGDALIAATARVHDLVLLTLNRRHYPMPEIRLATLPGARA